ncbi:MAG: Holliday junction resolvase RuvX [Steroidobacteraceae bacterium]
MHAPTHSPQVILAFDYGTRRIGVASGDTLTRTARPLQTFEHSGELPWGQFDRLVREFRPSLLVVGLPCNMDGTPTFLTETTREFARDLQARYRIDAVMVDERLSSREAEGGLREARASGLKTRRLTRGDIDMAAARILLERWFENPDAARDPREPAATISTPMI